MRVSLIFYIAFLILASIELHSASNIPLLILTGALFLWSLLNKQTNSPVWRILRIIFLSLFHLESQLYFCITLYLVLTIKETSRIQTIRQSVLIAALFFTLYTTIRLTYTPLSLLNLLPAIFDLCNFFAAVFTLQYYLKVAQEKRILELEKSHLSKHDQLTGLLNFHEYHKNLHQLLGSEKRLIHLLIDCTDLKSMNGSQGFQSGNQVLKIVAAYLNKLFPNAPLIARYGGDEFALSIPIEPDEPSPIDRFTISLQEDLPKDLGIEVTYGYAIYPDDGLNKDDLISISETRLFEMKREIWLKKEQHLLRSEKLRVVGELAAGMAHEIRNPLTTVKGFLQISKEMSYNIEPWYEIIMHEITRMNDLTVEFLQFSKPNANQFQVESLQGCIQKVIHLLESEAISLGHQLLIEVVDTPLWVLIDKDKITQVLLNLIKNSFDAMTRSGTVSIRLLQENQTGIIEIQDTGSGIPEDKLHQIFHPFYTTKDSGIGLGLYICHKIIQDHHGTIEVTSVVQKGTTFRISLPLAKTTPSTV